MSAQGGTIMKRVSMRASRRHARVMNCRRATSFPAALVTALNSDQAGRVIALVIAPVYDSVRGDHLLSHQGARLIGSYENAARYGDNRILLVWNRLIFPNGWSINLREMNASDPEGAAGLIDRTDNHLDRLAAAVGLSTIISVIANESEGEDNDEGSLRESIGEAAASKPRRPARALSIASSRSASPCACAPARLCACW